MNCGLSCFLMIGLGAVSKLHSQSYLEKILFELNPEWVYVKAKAQKIWYLIMCDLIHASFADRRKVDPISNKHLLDSKMETDD